MSLKTRPLSWAICTAIHLGGILDLQVIAEEQNTVTVYVVHTWKNERDKRLNPPDAGPERATHEEAEQVGRQMVAGGRAFDFVVKPESRITSTRSIPKRPEAYGGPSPTNPNPGSRMQIQMEESQKKSDVDSQVKRSRYADDLPALRREAINGVIPVFQRERGQKGTRPAIDEVMFNAETERILAERKMDRQIRDATKEIEAIQQALKQRANLIEEFQIQDRNLREKGAFTPTLTFSEKGELESAAARVQKAQQDLVSVQNLRIQGYRRTGDDLTDLRSEMSYNLQVASNQAELAKATQELEQATLQYTQLQTQLSAKLEKEVNDSVRRAERMQDDLRNAQEEYEKLNQGLGIKRQQLKELQTQKSKLASTEGTTSQEFTSPNRRLKLNASTQKNLREQLEQRRREP